MKNDFCTGNVKKERETYMHIRFQYHQHKLEFLKFDLERLFVKLFQNCAYRFRKTSFEIYNMQNDPL